MKTIDAIIAEIRESRERMSRETGNDPARYIQLLKAYNVKYAAQVRRFRRAHSKRRVATVRSK